MKRSAFIITLLLLFGWTTAIQAQEATPVPLATYWDTVRAVQTLVASFPENPGDADRQSLAVLADRLEQIKAVSLADGRVLQINTADLTRLMRAGEPDLARLEGLLTQLLAAEETWPAAQLDSLDEAALAAILSRSEFQYETKEPNAIQRFLQEARRRIVDFLISLLPEGQTSLPFGNLVTFIGVVALALILVYILRSLLSDVISEAAMAGDEGAEGSGLTAEAALRQADRISTAGDFRTAVRYLYLSSLLLLEERDLLRYDRTLTNREYINSLAHQPRLAAILQEVIEVFDRVWYGFQPLDAREYEAFALQVEKLKKQEDKS